MNANRILPVVGCLLLAGAVSAQDAADPADALRGPPVSDRTKRTLVRFNMSGEFERLEGRPEAAAALLLDLGEEPTRRVKEVIDARDLSIALLLVDQIDLVGALSDAIRAGETDQARDMQVGLWELLEPGHPRSPLLEPLRGVLGEADHAEVVRLTDEYWRALLDWETRTRQAEDPERAAHVREQTERRLALQMFQREVRDGYEATLRRYRDAMERVYQAVQPTDEQRAAMRETLLDHIRATKLKATPEQRRAATRRMYDLLDEQRRGLFFDYLLRQVIPSG